MKIMSPTDTLLGFALAALIAISSARPFCRVHKKRTYRADCVQIGPSNRLST
jgi:hypothetical protein